MKREQFIKDMNIAIDHIKSGWSIYSCCAIEDNVGSSYSKGKKVARDYANIFRPYGTDRDGFWLGVSYYETHPNMKLERIGMMELFREIAIDSKLYEKY